MRIALHDYAGFSFPLELSKELSKRNHNVMHLFTKASGGPKASVEEDSSGNIEISNIDVEPIDKDNFFKRWIQERRYGNLAVNALKKWEPDIVISGNTPLVAQAKIINWATKNAVPSIFWLHDLLSVAAQSILSNLSPVLGRLAFAYLNKVEIDALSKADQIVSVTDDFTRYLNQWRIDPAKISIIPNWGPIEQIPVLPQTNHFSYQHGLTDKFVILYAGTLGKKQGIRLIAGTAEKLADDKDILFVIATDRRGHHLLEQQLNGKKSLNVLRLPLQSISNYPYLLASADLTLITMEETAGKYCVPSKLWSSYCAQKPSIVAVGRQNQCARITEEILAGIVISPGAVDECVSAIKRLKNDEAERFRMGASARQYAERHFPISKVTDSFEAVIDKIIVDAGSSPA